GIDRDVGGLSARRRDKIVPEFERFGPCFSLDIQLGIGVRLYPDERNILKIASFICRCDSACLHLIGYILCRAAAAFRSRPAAFEIIGGKFYHTFTYFIDGESRCKVL